MKEESKKCDGCVHEERCRLEGRHVPTPCSFYYEKPEAKTPGKMKRILYFVNCVIFLIVFIPVWFVVVIARFPFEWIGKIADILDDLECSIRHAASDFAEIGDAMHPECAWMDRYKRVKEKYNKLLDEKFALKCKEVGAEMVRDADERLRKEESDE